MSIPELLTQPESDGKGPEVSLDLGRRRVCTSTQISVNIILGVLAHLNKCHKRVNKFLERGNKPTGHGDQREVETRPHLSKQKTRA